MDRTAPRSSGQIEAKNSSVLLWMIGLIFLGMMSLPLSLVYANPYFKGEPQWVPVALHSILYADYSADPGSARIPAAKLNLIKEALADQAGDDSAKGFEGVQEGLKTPVATVGSGLPLATATIAAPTATATSMAQTVTPTRSHPTRTASPTPTPTTVLLLPTRTPLATKQPTRTSKPARDPDPTDTPRPTQKPTEPRPTQPPPTKPPTKPPPGPYPPPPPPPKPTDPYP